jgi:hypothetical protein
MTATPSAQPDRVLVVNIVSVSYSGSTWINMMLGAHNEVFSVGEMKSVLRHGRALCKFHGENCPIWSRFTYPSDENPFLQIARLSGRRVLVINNSRVFEDDLHHPQIDAKYIHLVRDGRAVAASMLRKYPEQSMWHAARHWAKGVQKNRKLMARLPREQGLDLIYEDVVEQTQPQMQRVCRFLGLPWQDAILNYWDHEQHFLGGNRGALLSVAQKADVELSQSGPSLAKAGQRAPQYDESFYQKQDAAHFRDERWKTELSDWKLRLFALAAGRVNSQMGYARSLDRQGPRTRPPLT